MSVGERNKSQMVHMDHHYLLNRKTWCAWTGLVLIAEQLHIIVISFNVIVLVPLI